MMETMPTNQRYLKDIRQIGTPGEEEKIYIEKQAYNRIHQEDFQEKRVFILMGHTESRGSGYATFIEGIIPVRDIDFSKSTPRWDNRSWNDVFREIKRAYEEEIIVGWAVDMRGASPRITEDLEAVHREQFGGAHQVLFLADTLDNEECFYCNRKNHLAPKSGFYIYQKKIRDTAAAPMQVEVEIPREEPPRPKEPAPKPRYREFMRQEIPLQKPSAAPYRAYVSVAMILILIGAIGIGALEFHSQLSGIGNVVAAFAGSHAGTQKPKEPNPESGSGSESEDDDSELAEIPVEKLPSHLTEDTQTAIADQMPEAPEQPGALDQPQTPGQSGVLNQPQQPGQSGALDQPQQPEQSGAAGQPGNSEDVAQADAETGYILHVVAEKETLYGICRKYLLSPDFIPEICNINGIEDPDHIRVGQKLQIPQ